MATPNVDTREFLSQTKFYEGYSRFKEYGNGGYESWNEAVDRVLEMHEENYAEFETKLRPHLEEARTAYKEQRVLGAQRALQFGGEHMQIDLNFLESIFIFSFVVLVQVFLYRNIM